MRFDLAQKVHKELKKLQPFWLDRLSTIDLYESRFEATIEAWTSAYTDYGARSLCIAVPFNAIGNRPIDGVTGVQGGDDARTVVLDVQWSTCQEHLMFKHPMIGQGSKSFDFSVQADQLFDWMNRFVQYEPDASADGLSDAFKRISVAGSCEGELSDWELVEKSL